MKKLSMLKSITAGALFAWAATALAPLGVSAQWKENTDNTWSYTEGTKKVTGWKKVDGKWYYFNNSGKMQTGYIQINGRWYYFDKNGCWIPNGNQNNGSNSTTDKVEDSINKDEEVQKPDNNTGNGNNNSNNVDKNESEVNDNIPSDDKNESNGAEDSKDENTDADKNDNNNDLNSGNNSSDNNISNENNSNINKLPPLPEVYSTTIEASAEEKILELMNGKRREAGLKPLTMDNTLRDVARYKSSHMIQYNYFNHTNPDGTTWQNWLKTLGYSYTATAENIAYNSSSAEKLFDQWWNSAGHKANMMNPSYTKVGIGVIYGNGKHMGTQTFSN